jgi:urease accessory protein
MLRGFGANLHKVLAAFQPEGGAYAHGHHHQAHEDHHHHE